MVMQEWARAAGSSVVLQGVNPSDVQNDTLWSPGQTSGLTKEYLIARNSMVSAMITMAGEGQLPGGSVNTDSSNSFIYTDLMQSPNPLYSINGQGGRRYEYVFADDNGDTLSVSPGAYAEIFGGAGNDILYGGTLGGHLQGGAGNDEYVIDGSGTGTDQILDTDGQGSIEWQYADGSIQVLNGGNKQTGTSAWESANGLITYFEELSADGSTELGISSGNKTVYVDDFTNGEFGITLNTSPASPSGLQVTAQNSMNPGLLVVGPEFDDNGSLAPISSALLGPVDTSGQIWAINGFEQRHRDLWWHGQRVAVGGQPHVLERRPRRYHVGVYPGGQRRAIDRRWPRYRHAGGRQRHADLRDCHV